MKKQNGQADGIGGISVRITFQVIMGLGYDISRC